MIQRQNNSILKTRRNSYIIYVTNLAGDRCPLAVSCDGTEGHFRSEDELFELMELPGLTGPRGTTLRDKKYERMITHSKSVKIY